MEFWHKIKMYRFDPYYVLLVFAINIPVLLTTGCVVQGHIYINEMTVLVIATCALHSLFY